MSVFQLTDSCHPKLFAFPPMTDSVHSLLDFSTLPATLFHRPLWFSSHLPSFSFKAAFRLSFTNVCRPKFGDFTSRLLSFAYIIQCIPPRQVFDLGFRNFFSIPLFFLFPVLFRFLKFYVLSLFMLFSAYKKTVDFSSTVLFRGINRIISSRTAEHDELFSSRTSFSLSFSGLSSRNPLF